MIKLTADGTRQVSTLKGILDVGLANQELIEGE